MSKYWRYPARVLGCLRTREITVVLFPQVGLVDGGIPTILLARTIPPELRMPNCEFDILMDATSQEVIGILRKNEIFPNLDRAMG